MHRDWQDVVSDVAASTSHASKRLQNYCVGVQPSGVITEHLQIECVRVANDFIEATAS